MLDWCDDSAAVNTMSVPNVWNSDVCIYVLHTCVTLSG